MPDEIRGSQALTGAHDLHRTGGAEESVAIRRTLAANRPAAFLPDLAGSLHNLALDYAQSGNSEEAVAAGREAVEAYAALAPRYPAVFRDKLRDSLHNLRLHYGGEARDAADPVVIEARRVLAELDAVQPGRTGASGHETRGDERLVQPASSEAADDEARGRRTSIN